LKAPSPKSGEKGELEERPRPAIRRSALHAQVLDKLRRLIANGDLPAGERLNELQIATSFRVSRTPIREAVKLLASEGLVELLPGRGARVKRLTRQEVLENFEILAARERHAVETTVRRMTEAQRQELTALHERMEKSFAVNDARDYFDVNQRLHRFFVRAVGNAALAAVHEGAMKRARRQRPLTLASAQRWSASMAEHAELYAAALRGDAERAGVLMLQHLQRTGEAIAESADPDLEA
jgi:DNA-binding GntR family transcriptional regulator